MIDDLDKMFEDLQMDDDIDLVYHGSILDTDKAQTYDRMTEIAKQMARSRNILSVIIEPVSETEPTPHIKVNTSYLASFSKEESNALAELALLSDSVLLTGVMQKAIQIVFCVNNIWEDGHWSEDTSTGSDSTML